MGKRRGIDAGSLLSGKPSPEMKWGRPNRIGLDCRVPGSLFQLIEINGDIVLQNQ